MRRKHIEPPPAPPEPASDQRGALTIPQLMRRWSTSRNTIVAAIKAGRLHAFKIGTRVYRVPESEILRYERESLAVAS